MNPGRYIHTARVRRNTQGVVSSTGLMARPGLTVVSGASALAILCEGLPSRGRGTILGRIQGAKYVVSWAGIILRENDIFDQITGVPMAANKAFRLAEIVDDSTRLNRNYYTGILAEYQAG